MERAAARFGVQRPRGLRGGVVIGLALALVGAGVGTASGAITPFQQVVIVNTASNPIPISGTISGSVNVGNFPANQNVNVTNLPATQAVSGTVSLGTTDGTHLANIDGATGKLTFDGTGNLKTASTPAGPALATKFKTDFITAGDNSTSTLDLGGTINATLIVLNDVANPDGANGVTFSLNGDDRLTLFGASGGSGDVVVPLAVAIPINKITLRCSTQCEVWVSVAGF
ncbi:MAG: hypothetical protein ABIR11_06930 [Candidatus Limnocylindrales bacterium]